MRNGKFWNLLNQLLGSNCSKSNQRHRLKRILNLAIKDASEEAIVDNLIHRYLPTGPVATHPDYKGSLNPKLDSEFSTEEIRTALQDLGRSAPGPDGITNSCAILMTPQSGTSLKQSMTTGIMVICLLNGRHRIPHYFRNAAKHLVQTTHALSR